MIREEIGNLVTGNYPVFCHQVNCKGVMGAGLAKQIREKYGEVYKSYKNLCDQGDAKVGIVQYVNTFDNRICVNMFAQYSYGRDRQYTNYEAFKKCLEQLEKFLLTSDVKEVAFPKYIGCGLAGGVWSKILEMLEDFEKIIKQDVVIVRLK